jgi:putative NADH-flavin reductase
MDEEDFPPERRPSADAQVRALALLEWSDDLDWTWISPPASIEPGERTGQYRVGGEELLVDDEGLSRITIPDYAVAFADELEQPTVVRTGMTVAW